jgi:hypothetical protein
MKETLNRKLEHGEFYACVTYDAPNPCFFYKEVKNGFRSAFWTTSGISTAIMFIDIPGDSLLPGDKKDILCYSINSQFAIDTISSSKVYWGPAICAMGIIKAINNDVKKISSII